MDTLDRHGAGGIDLVALGRKFYIDGRWVDPVEPVMIDVVDPYTEEVFARVPGGGPADIDRAVAAAARAFESYSATSREERLALLRRIAECYEANKEGLAQALSREMGVPIAYARAMQVPTALRHCEAMIRVLESYPFERADGSLLVRKEAIGVCGLITPWNWPLYQITAKVAPALAAGCTIVLKPSELSP